MDANVASSEPGPELKWTNQQGNNSTADVTQQADRVFRIEFAIAVKITFGVPPEIVGRAGRNPNRQEDQEKPANSLCHGYPSSQFQSIPRSHRVLLQAIESVPSKVMRDRQLERHV